MSEREGDWEFTVYNGLEWNFVIAGFHPNHSFFYNHCLRGEAL